MVFKVRWVDSSEYLAHCADTKAALRYSVSFLWSVESRGWNAIILNCIVVKEESLKTVCRDWCHLKYVFFFFQLTNWKGWYISTWALYVYMFWYENDSYAGRRLARLVAWASHVRRLCPRCSGPWDWSPSLGLFFACHTPLISLILFPVTS